MISMNATGPAADEFIKGSLLMCADWLAYEPV